MWRGKSKPLYQVATKESSPLDLGLWLTSSILEILPHICLSFINIVWSRFIYTESKVCSWVGNNFAEPLVFMIHMSLKELCEEPKLWLLVFFIASGRNTMVPSLLHKQWKKGLSLNRTALILSIKESTKTISTICNIQLLLPKCIMSSSLFFHLMWLWQAYYFWMALVTSELGW